MIVLLAAALLLPCRQRFAAGEDPATRRTQYAAAVTLVLDTLPSTPTELSSASTMKVPVMIELFRRANTGLSGWIGAADGGQFASLVDGRPTH
jgi:hypothetical protein